MTRGFAVMVLSAALASGCGGGEGAKEGQDCATALDCQDGMVCLAYGDSVGACSLDCSVSADVCGAEASCAGVGSVGIDVCQDNDKVTDENNPPEGEDDVPYIPCLDDAECQALGGGSRMVCGEWMGMRQCTLSCEAEDQCTVVPMMDFLTCLDDEGDASRDICVPDMACFTDPMSCIDMGGGTSEWTDWPTY